MVIGTAACNVLDHVFRCGVGEMDSQVELDEIRKEMIVARAALMRDTDAAASDARALTDWRTHFRAHPWLICGGAVAIGFVLVPRKERSSGAQIAERAVSQFPNADQPHTKGLAATAIGLAATFLVKQSLNYLTRRGMDWIGVHAAQRREPTADQFHR